MGLMKDFLKWLRTPDEEEIVDGEINIKAFKGEDPKMMQELHHTAKKVNNMGNGMFMSKAKQRAETVSSMKAQVKTPSSQEQTETKEPEKQEEGIELE